jgi:hypothetical protein
MPLSSEQLQQVSEAIANFMAKQTPQMLIESLLGLPSTGTTEPDMMSYNYLAQVQSYDHDVG